MSAALALSQSASALTATPAKRPALNLVPVAEASATLAQAQKLRKRVALRNRLGAMMDSATSMAMFHAYRPY